MQNLNYIYLRSLIDDKPRLKDDIRNLYINTLNAKLSSFKCLKNNNIFFIETGGTEEFFKKIYIKYPEPYYLLAIDSNNSLPACLEIATFLKNNHKEFKVFHGSVDEIVEQIINENCIKKAENCTSFSKISCLKGERYGVIGKPSDWLIASDIDYKEAFDKLGLTLVDIDVKELIDLTSNIKVKNERFKDFVNPKISNNEIIKALQIYEAIKYLVKKYNLNGVTVRCFDLLGTIKSTACLALAMLNEEEIIATCEGDIPTMITMGIIKKITGQSSFQVNPSYINLKKKIAYFAHCTIPLDMCKSFSLDTHFESGIGVGIKGELKEEEITIFKLSSNLQNYELFEGKIVQNLNKTNLCRTQIKVKFIEDISSMFSSPYGNHLVIMYGKHKKELVEDLSQ